MRIAVSGAHAVGKTALIGELAGHLPDYEVVEEAYYSLIDEGVAFADPPTPADFESQLERSIDQLAAHDGPNVLFDRCPVDYFGYLSALRSTPRETLSYWLQPMAESLASLDLIVFVPIELPDRIDGADSEMPRQRARVDRALRQFLIDDTLGLGLEVIQVEGGIPERARQLLARAGSAPSPRARAAASRPDRGSRAPDERGPRK